MSEPNNRRPLASRETGWARTIAKRLAASPVTPNQISQASMAAAAAAGLAFWVGGQSGDPAIRAMLFIAAALFCQLRLLCNLFDGMVAVEGGKSAPDGGFWNEFPDRVADVLILTSAGYGIGEPGLGWAAACFALFTAYVRELGVSTGGAADFAGPMAKQHRMATITAAALITTLEPMWSGRNEVLTVALWIIATGAAFTALRRAVRLVRRMRR